VAQLINLLYCSAGFMREVPYMSNDSILDYRRAFLVSAVFLFRKGGRPKAAYEIACIAGMAGCF